MPGILDTIDGRLYVVSGKYFKLLTFNQKQNLAHQSDMRRLMARKYPPLRRNVKQHCFAEEVRQGQPLPATFSRRTQMTPVRNQGSRGTCTVFGTQALHEYNWAQSRDFAEQFLYWGAKQIDNTTEGTWIKDAWATLLGRGVCQESLCPYTTTQPFPKWGGPTPSQAAQADAANYKGKQNWWIAVNDANYLKRIIYEFHYVIPVQVSVWNSCWPSSGVVTMPTARNIQQTKKVLRSVRVNGVPAANGEHVICLTGYDDATRRFEFKNSWDTWWGAAGYGTIPYDYVTHYGRDAIVYLSH